MTAESPLRGHQEVSRLGTEIYDSKIKPTLDAHDHGKFVAIDIDSGDFEINDDDLTATTRLRNRKPDAEVWLMRAGFRSAYHIGFVQ